MLLLIPSSQASRELSTEPATRSAPAGEKKVATKSADEVESKRPILPTICNSGDCQRIGNTIRSLHRSAIDPCDDFYGHVCKDYSSPAGSTLREVCIFCVLCFYRKGIYARSVKNEIFVYSVLKIRISLSHLSYRKIEAFELEL